MVAGIAFPCASLREASTGLIDDTQTTHHSTRGINRYGTEIRQLRRLRLGF